MRSKDTQITNTHQHQMITTRKEFFIQFLDQFAETGNDLLRLLDDIESGEVQCFIL